ncbi:hypothetical protein QQF64_023531, partial [Cirrhinus molitorella]
DGWIFYINPIFKYISSRKMNWYDSRKYCKGQTADLIIINNRDEHHCQVQTKQPRKLLGRKRQGQKKGDMRSKRRNLIPSKGEINGFYVKRREKARDSTGVDRPSERNGKNASNRDL